MVGPIGPGKFYGSSLPRPRFYTDIKHNHSRVDPPASVTDPLMSWAEEAHWSMGGLAATRRRLQGRIEGNVERLRAQQENSSNKHDDVNRGVVRKFGDAFEKDCVAGGDVAAAAASEGTVGEGKVNKRKKY